MTEPKNASEWPALKKAIWDAVTSERLNDGHYINAYHLTDKIYAAARASAAAAQPVAWPTIDSAPKDRFIIVYCPEDQSRWLVKWQGGEWYGTDCEYGLTRTGHSLGDPEYVTGWFVSHWREVPDFATPSPLPAPGEVKPLQWECMGRKQSLPDPGECSWPDCGCDPHATKVIESLLEQGWRAPGEVAGGGVATEVTVEMHRIKRLFEYSNGDKEDLISYAKGIVALRTSATLSPGGGAVEALLELAAFEFYRFSYPNRWDWSRNKMWDGFQACRGSITWRQCIRSAEALRAALSAQADGVALKAGEILGIKPSLDRDLAERQIPETFQAELRALRGAVTRPQSNTAAD